MTLPELLGILEERGVWVLLTPEGALSLRGPDGALTAALEKVVEARRGEILAHLLEKRSKRYSRRVVVAATGELLKQFEPGGDWGVLARCQEDRPGESLAIEHYKVDVQGSWQWVRFAAVVTGQSKHHGRQATLS
jgi:hypothetical protein